MAQQRIKFVQKEDADTVYAVTVETDTNTLTAQPIALDAGEDFRLIVADGLTESEIMSRVQQFITQIRNGQHILDAALL